MSPSYSERSSGFLALSSRKDLALWLGLSDRELRYILYVLSPEEKYKTFKIRKRNGGERIIEAPHPALKNLQRKVLHAISEIAPASILSKGYVKGRSIVDHAWLHRRKSTVVLADLQNFFPTITFPRVRGALLAKPFGLNSQVATCVAQLCCKNGVLPQGAPTSPALSNLICKSLDHSLLNLAKKNRVSVSRYADDICFSTSQRPISKSIAEEVSGEWVPGSSLSELVNRSGFALNVSKFKVRHFSDRQLVTGLVVNDGVSLPREWRRQLRVIINLVRKNGEKKADEIISGWSSPTASRSGCTSSVSIIRGKSNYAHYVDRRCKRGFTDSLFRAYPTQRKFLPVPLGGVPLRLMAEGKTDLLHIEAAYRYFVGRGDYGHLKPRFHNFPGDTGDVELMKTLNRIAKSDIPELTIGIFDCDNPSFLKNSGLSPGGYVQIGASVFAMCLAPPDELDGVPFCIELLYPRDQLCAFASDHRRVFLLGDFDPTTGVSHDGLFKRAIPKKTSLVVDDAVTRISDGYSSNLSKSSFANLVAQGVPPFAKMDFDSFSRTFEVMSSVSDIFVGRA